MARRPAALSVVACHHTGDLILQCLAAVRKQRGVTYETYVVTSDPHRIFDGTTTIHSTAGPAEKRNLAAARCQTPYLVFLDDDILDMREDCLKQLWWGMEKRPQAGAAFCKILKSDRRNIFDDCGSFLSPTGFLWSRAGNDQVDHGQYDEAERILSSKSATCIIRRLAFDAVNGFDRAYRILGEESDLAWRLWLHGWEVWYLPTAVSFHAFGTSAKPITKYYTLDRIHFDGAKNYISLLVTNLSGKNLFWMLPIHVAAWIISVIGFACKGELVRAWLIMCGLGWNIVHVQKTWRKRRGVQSHRVISDDDLFKIILRRPTWAYYKDRLFRYWKRGLHG